MINHVVLMGRVTETPELRHTPAGTPVANFTVAVERNFKNNLTGERETDFLDVVAWNGRAEFAAKYLSKGRMVVVDGHLQVQDWIDKNGNKRRSVEVVAGDICLGSHISEESLDDVEPAEK